MRAALMPAVWRLSLIGLALTLFAAGAHAQTGTPVYRGNDTGGIIPWSCENEAEAQEVAAAFCKGYGKFARITSVHRMYGDYIAFNCLWRPDIARFQIPAVRTRSSCYAPRPRVRVRY